MKTVCVTGAGGFVASWLVERLLAGGRYKVHGTVRDPGDAKNAHLLGLDGAAERLQLFKADLLDFGSVAAAIAGCDGVFHVACPVPDYALTDPETELLAPAVTGTMNVLRASSDAQVRRVVVVSSLSAVMINPDWGECKVMDEGCWSDVDLCRTTKDNACTGLVPPLDLLSKDSTSGSYKKWLLHNSSIRLDFSINSTYK